MPFSDSNRVSIRAIPESISNWGATPASGTSREVRFTSSTLAASKETVMSDEIRADRMVSAIPEVAASSGGDLNFELSAGGQDDYLQALLAGAWSRPMTFDFFRGTLVSFTANNTLQVAGGDFRSYFTVGRRIKTEGFVNSANNNYWQISATAFTAGNTVITLTATTGVVEAGSAFTKVSDANDVVILRDTTIRFSAGNVIDVAAGTPFASARAAGQLFVGQKIFVEGRGFGTGTVAFTAVAQAGAQVTVNDGVNSIVFNYGSGAADVATGAAAADSATNLASAINRARIFGVNGVRINVDATAAAGTVTVRNFNLVGGSIAETADPGATFSVTTFSGGAANARGVYTITAVTDSAITVAETIPTSAAGPATTIKASTLKNPGDPLQVTPQSFSFETAFTDNARFLVKNGMRVGSMSLDVSSGAIVTGTMSFMGRQTTPRNTTLIGAAPYTFLPAPATEVLNATSNVGSVTKNGVTLASAVQSISLQIDGANRNQSGVGSKFPRGVGLGRITATGSLMVYFETFEMYNHFINHETISLGWSFQDVDGNAYFYTLPAVKITSDPVAPSGIDQDVMENLEFMTFRDPVTACQVQIDRFSSVFPV